MNIILKLISTQRIEVVVAMEYLLFLNYQIIQKLFKDRLKPLSCLEY